MICVIYALPFITYIINWFCIPTSAMNDSFSPIEMPKKKDGLLYSLQTGSEE